MAPKIFYKTFYLICYRNSLKYIPVIISVKPQGNRIVKKIFWFIVKSLGYGTYLLKIDNKMINVWNIENAPVDVQFLYLPVRVLVSNRGNSVANPKQLRPIDLFYTPF